MSNPYFTFSPRFIPGTKVRAQAVNTQFDLLEDAFDLLPASGAAITTGTATLGVESGSGNAYVVTMPNTRLANAEGDEVVFKATHQNSGPSTLQVDAIPAAPLVRGDGTALSSGDVLSGSFYVARYSAALIKFFIVAPAQSTIVGALTYAAPTGQVKLTASAGAASTLIRSDANIALDQSISPTWSGTHTFSNPTLAPAGIAALPGYAFSAEPGTGMFRSALNTGALSGGGVRAARFDNTAFYTDLPLRIANGTPAVPSAAFDSSPTTGVYRVSADRFGIAVAGVSMFRLDALSLNISSAAVYVQDGTNTAPSYSFNNDSDTGQYSVASNTWGVATGGVLRFSVNGSGNGVFTGTVSGTNLSATGGANPSASVGLTAVNGSATTFMRSDAAPALSVSIAPTWSGVHTFQGTDLSGLNAPLVLKPAASGNTGLQINCTNAAADNRIWRVIGDTAGGFTIGTANDAGTVGNGAIGISRSGATVSNITFGAAQLRAPDGSLGAPAYSFTNDTNTGWRLNAADDIILEAGGNTFFRADGTNNAVYMGRNSSTSVCINGVTEATASAGGGASVPATVAGFLDVIINSSVRKIPYFNS